MKRSRLQKDAGKVHMSRLNRLRAEVVKDWNKFSHSQRVDWIKRHREHFSTLGVLSTAEIPVIAALSTGNFLLFLLGLGLGGVPLGIGYAMKPKVLPRRRAMKSAKVVKS